MSKGEGELSYCAQLVREQDHDRYLTTLFLPAEHREAIFALYAFNAEVARTRETVSELILGQIRLQWWHESLDSIYQGEVREHPVIEGLNQAVQAYDLDKAAFSELIDARAADLEDTPPSDLAALEVYARATSGTLAAMVVKVLGHAEGAPVEAASKVGTAWALLGLMRAIGFHAQAKRLYLPDDLLQGHEVDRGALFNLKPSPPLNRVVREVTSRAAELLAEARDLKREVPPAARRGLLLAVLADRYLKDIVRADYDPFELSAAMPAQPLRLTWASIRKTY